MRHTSTTTVCLLAAALASSLANAFSATANSNVAVYWGQNSEGSQARLADYCKDTSADIVILSFLSVFYGTGGYPELHFGAGCEDGSVFSGTNLLQCPTIAEDIVSCQAQGKKVLLSLGGSGGTYGFDTAEQGTVFADTLWNLFLGGTSDFRPFGTAVLDGFDLDIEDGGSIGYTEFVTELRLHFADSTSKSYYISAAPQCVLPDAYLNTVIMSAKIDFVFVQFYNNLCGMQAWSADDGDAAFNFAGWDSLIASSYNPNAMVYLGVPASSTAAGSGYVSISTVLQAASYLQTTYSNFGGIMMWDASQAWANTDSTSGLNFAAAAKAGLLGGTSEATSVVESTSASTTNWAVAESTTSTADWAVAETTASTADWAVVETTTSTANWAVAETTTSSKDWAYDIGVEYATSTAAADWAVSTTTAAAVDWAVASGPAVWVDSTPATHNDGLWHASTTYAEVWALQARAAAPAATADQPSSEEDKDIDAEQEETATPVTDVDAAATAADNEVFSFSPSQWANTLSTLYRQPSTTSSISESTASPGYKLAAQQPKVSAENMNEANFEESQKSSFYGTLKIYLNRFFRNQDVLSVPGTLTDMAVDETKINLKLAS